MPIISCALAPCERPGHVDAATVVAPVVVVVAAAAERRGLTGRPRLAWDPIGSQTVVAEPARVTATVDTGPMQRLRAAEAKDFQRGLPVLCSTGFIAGHVEPCTTLEQVELRY